MNERHDKLVNTSGYYMVEMQFGLKSWQMSYSLKLIFMSITNIVKLIFY